MNTRGKTVAVILSAGSGTRMGEGVAKQQCLLLGQSLLSHTVRAFDHAQGIDGICLVVRSEDMPLAESIAARCRKPVTLCIGAGDRQGSARIGVRSLSDDVTYVAIHDGARCLVTPQIIEKTVEKAWQTGAACAVERVVDTVKTVNTCGQIVGTCERDTLRLAQTPQVFSRALYEEALDHAQQQRLCVTDDCALVEVLGREVSAVEHTDSNFKVTYKKDLFLAECILKERGIEA